MVERASPLAALPPRQPAQAVVRLSELRPASLLLVAAWPDSLARVEAVLAERLGVPVPPVGTAAADPNLTLAAIAPGRFLLAGMAPDLVPRLEAALPDSDAAVTDLLHARIILRVEGDAAALLARVVALDLDPAAFPSGRVAQTAIHHIDVMLHRLNRATFHLWGPRSFAVSLLDWLLDAGAEIGVAFDP